MAAALLLTCLTLTAAHRTAPPGNRSLALFPSGPRAVICTEAPGPGVDLNQANAEQLQTLPGIGAELARRILEEREQNGPFLYVEDLLSVKGVGPKMLEKLRRHVSLSQP